MFASLLALAPLGVACAQDAAVAPSADATTPAATAPAAASEQAACKQETRRNGVGETAGDAVCTIKRLFQSRIRRRPDADPVEMTVGSPPMFSEDTDTPGAGNWELNIAMGAEWARGARAIEFPVLDINYGLGDRVQLTYAVPYVFLHEPGASANGVGDSELALKYRFYDNEDRGISLAVYPQLRLHTPGASDAVSEGRSWAVPVMLVSEFEHFSLTANLGLQYEAGERSTFASFGGGRRLTDRLSVLAEVYGHHLGGDGRHVLANLGVRQKLAHGQTISAALGHDIDAAAGEPRLSYLTLNYQKMLGEE
jgi:hypothetical protein